MAEEVSTLVKLSAEEARDMALVDLAYEILKAGGNPLHYRELMQEISQLRGMTEEDIQSVIAMLYTEINIDGRFLCIGNNTWGLKRWYPVDKTAERSFGSKKFIRKDDDLYDDEDEDLYLEEELDEAEADYDGIDEDDEDLDYEDIEDIEEDVDDFADEVIDEEEPPLEDEDEDF